jgi:dihydroxyacid dehydratase/phosphogluconate dehydratase
VRGNVTESAVFKRAGMSPEAIALFDRKVFVAVFYLGEAEAQQDLFQGRVLERLATVRPELLRRLARVNFGDRAAVLDTCPEGDVLQRAASERLLRAMVVIAGEGPKANGIPEMFYPSEYLNRDPVLRHVAGMITDGRYSGATYGPCIGHASPEALEGGRLGAVRTGDLLYMDTSARRLDVLDLERSFGLHGFSPVALAGDELDARPELLERIAWLRARRRQIPASIRLLLDATTPCRDGVTPTGLEIAETW